MLAELEPETEPPGVRLVPLSPPLPDRTTLPAASVTWEELGRLVQRQG